MLKINEDTLMMTMQEDDDIGCSCYKDGMCNNDESNIKGCDGCATFKIPEEEM